MPVRWLEANAHGYRTASGAATAGPPYIEYTNMQPAGVPQAPRVLLWGDDDLEFMDANESILERTVGQICLEVTVMETSSSVFPLPVVRLGLLVSDDLEDQTQAPAIDLFERESVEEHRWLWLQQVGEFERAASQTPGDDTFWTTFRRDVAIDSSVHRKLGKKDALLLYCQFGIETPPGFDVEYDVIGRYVELIRCLMKTK